MIRMSDLHGLTERLLRLRGTTESLGQKRSGRIPRLKKSGTDMVPGENIVIVSKIKIPAILLR